jgi:hypothetical protein
MFPKLSRAKAFTLGFDVPEKPTPLPSGLHEVPLYIAIPVAPVSPAVEKFPPA